MPNWNEIKKNYPPEIVSEMQRLYNLRNSKDVVTKRRLRKNLRDSGYLSLPFSMNKNDEK